MAEKISDTIEFFIKEQIDGNEQPEALLKRNELAARFGCAPSQINYVIRTRFSRDRGYLVESRRGGGGCIIIYKVSAAENGSGSYIAELLESLPEAISQQTARLLLESVAESGEATAAECRIMYSAVNDSALSLIPRELRDAARSHLLRGMLLAALRS